MPQDNVVVFHPGTQHSWQTALALQELGRLEFLATSIFYQSGRWPYRLENLPGPLGKAFKNEFKRFTFPELNPELVRTGGHHEWIERLATRAGFEKLAHAIDRRGNAAFGRLIERDIRSDRRFALWGYNNSSLEVFQLGKENGRQCILDRTIGDGRAYNQIIAALREEYGDWFSDTTGPIPRQTIEREEEEYAYADRILVGSEFAAETIRREATGPEVADRLQVLEYNFDDRHFAALPAPGTVGQDRPIRFLFAGLGIPRKGIHHVLEAIARFSPKDAELTILGKLNLPSAIVSQYRDRFTHIPTVPRSDVAKVMAAHDVLLFPTYFEGAGLVLYEALAAGMALIQSDRAAIAVTPDTGILLERPDSALLEEAMHKAIGDRGRLNHWRSQAQRSAQAYRFSGYRQRIAELLDDLVG